MHYSNGLLTPVEPAIDLVRILSEGTYTSFPQALKEFVSNAFDADATRVDIQVDEEVNGITIRDNGEGMTLADFGDAFASIARSGKPRRICLPTYPSATA
jgi:DNA mismatch repair ATPase MutL